MHVTLRYTGKVPRTNAHTTLPLITFFSPKKNLFSFLLIKLELTLISKFKTGALMINKSILTYFALIPLFASCATTGARKELILKRATFDFDCSIEKLISTKIDGSTFGITGCGKKAVYIVDCGGNSNIGACRAILNSQPLKKK